MFLLFTLQRLKLISIETAITTLNKAVLYFENMPACTEQKKLLALYGEARIASSSLELIANGKEKSDLVDYLFGLCADFDTYFVARHG